MEDEAGLTSLDRLYLDRAYELAARGIGSTSPNPPVGAVVVRDGKILGEGYHHVAGAPHAEANALAQAGDALRRDALRFARAVQSRRPHARVRASGRRRRYRRAVDRHVRSESADRTAAASRVCATPASKSRSPAIRARCS